MKRAILHAIRNSMFLFAFLFIPSLHTFGQVSITPDNTPPHPSAMLDVQATDAGVLVPRMTQAQRLAIGAPANGLMVFQINGESGFYYYNGTTWQRIGVNAGRYIGEHYAGGIIFRLDETGQHGHIVSMTDLSTSQPWSNITNVEIGDSAQSIWNGLINSLAIVNQAQHTSSAAQLCLDYVNPDYGTGVFGDWFLPSTGETRHLSNNIYEVQRSLELDGNPATTPISDGIYWTSVEATADSAWGCGVSDGDSNFYFWIKISKSEPLFVRAVRAF